MCARAAYLLSAGLLAAMPATVSAEITYNVHGAVIFTRAGERTPFLGESDPLELTSLGADQAYAQGTMFRQRYIEAASSDAGLETSTPMNSLSAYTIENDQLYILAPDDGYSGPTAQAFMQGLYPPFSFNTTAFHIAAAESTLANNTYVEAPLDGYQYPRVRTASSFDPNRLWVSGTSDCANHQSSAQSYFASADFNSTSDEFDSLYHDVGTVLLTNVVPEGLWDYANAYALYDYLNYGYVHDAHIHSILSDGITLPGALVKLRYLASRQQWILNSDPDSPSVGDSSNGIRSIAGRTLAAKVLGLLSSNIGTQGTQYKLSLLFGEFQPIISFFSLAGLDNAAFQGIPEWASSMVFELFSIGDTDDNSTTTITNSTYPNDSELWVRFYFRNGTDSSSLLVARPLFGRGPSETDMKWSDFETSMRNIMLAGIGSWCNVCGALSLFCPAFNLTLAEEYNTGSSHGLGVSYGDMTPQVAGVIGAGVTLGVGMLIVLAGMLLGGLRVHRVGGSRRRSELGGFKGGAKMASDADVSFAKNGAPFGVAVTTVEQDGNGKRTEDCVQSFGGRERVGSWELSDAQKTRLSGSTALDAEVGKVGDAKRVRDEDVDAISTVESVDGDVYARPVAPDERV